MKNKISYLIMSLVFFNLLFIFYYYFKIVSFSYINLFRFNMLIDLILINLFILVTDILYMLIYKVLGLEKLSYFLIVLIGAVIGLLSSVILLGLKGYEFGDYLSLVSYFTINTIFITYSLNFQKEKNAVFS